MKDFARHFWSLFRRLQAGICGVILVVAVWQFLLDGPPIGDGLTFIELIGWTFVIVLIAPGILAAAIATHRWAESDI
jgi:uncharacterized membrane protein